VHSADGWEDMLLPEIGRQQKLDKEVVFGAGAACAKPEIYEVLEERGVKKAIRIPSNDCLDRDIAEMLTRPVGRPSQQRGLVEGSSLPGCELKDGVAELPPVPV